MDFEGNKHVNHLLTSDLSRMFEFPILQHVWDGEMIYGGATTHHPRKLNNIDL